MSLHSETPLVPMHRDLWRPEEQNTSGALYGGQSSNDQTVRDVIYTLRNRVLWITLWALGAFAVGLLVCAFMTPQYTATATVLVDKQAGLDLGELASAVGGSDDAKTELETQVNLIQGSSTALAVAKQLDLMRVAPFRPSPSFFHFSKPKPEPDTASLETNPGIQGWFLYNFGKHLKVETKQDTRLILVHVVNPDPKEAATIANTIVNVYLQQYLETRFRATAHASNWVSSQLDDLKSRVDASQEKVVDYAHKNGLSGMMLGLGSGSSGSSSSSSSGGSGSSGGSAHIPEVDKLDELNTALTAAESERIEKEAIYQLTQTNSPDVVSGLANSSLATSSGSAVLTESSGLSQLNALRLQEAGLKVAYADAATRYGKLNPRLASMSDQMRTLDEQISQELARINERAKSDFELAKATEDKLRQSYDQQQAIVEKLNDSAIQLEVLAGEAAASRELYEGLLTKLQEASVEAGVKASNINLVDPARIPASPTRPNWTLYPAIALAGGLFLGIASAFALETLDDFITTPDQIVQLTSLPVLAGIPAFRPVNPDSGGAMGRTESSLLITKPNDPVSETYRGLRTSIQMSGDVNSMRSLLVTSPLQRDGKTTVSYNLSIAFAQQGKRVLTIDADMRKPRLQRLVGASKSPGLSDVLAKGIDWKTVVHPHPNEKNLSFIFAGTSSPMPAELIGLGRFDTLLDELTQHYDLVLIDSPPSLLVTDALILSTKVSGTIVVLRSGVTTRTALKRTLEILSRSHGRKLGLILNGLNTNSSAYYYSYGYYGKSQSYAEEGTVS